MIKHLSKFSTIGALSLTAVLATAPSAFAFSYVTSTFTSGNLVQTLFGIIEFFAAILFVILLIIGGIQYLGSFGNEEATTKARKLLLDAVVGLVIVVAAGAIAGIVLGQLGLGGFSEAGIGNITR